MQFAVLILTHTQHTHTHTNDSAVYSLKVLHSRYILSSRTAAVSWARRVLIYLRQKRLVFARTTDQVKRPHDNIQQRQRLKCYWFLCTELQFMNTELALKQIAENITRRKLAHCTRVKNACLLVECDMNFGIISLTNHWIKITTIANYEKKNTARQRVKANRNRMKWKTKLGTVFCRFAICN